MLCRMRLSPGMNPTLKKAKNVGVIDRLKRARLPCTTQSPSVLRFRMAKAPDVHVLHADASAGSSRCRGAGTAG